MILKYLIPGLLMILMGFWTGSHSEGIFGLLSFLPFFMAGVFLIIRGSQLSGKGKG